MRRISTAALIVILALPAFSQQKLVETIEVRVANIDVVVRDRAGTPVTGLTKDDFELYEDGVKQTITNLYEVRRDDGTGAKLMDSAGASDVPAELRQRRLVLFVDCASLQPARKRLVLASVEKFIDRMQPEDQAMLVAWRLGLRVVTPFTSDKAALKSGMTALEKMGPAGAGSRRAAWTWFVATSRASCAARRTRSSTGDRPIRRPARASTVTASR